MKAEREKLEQTPPVLEINTPYIITPEYLDDYGDHLNQALVLTIFSKERLRMFDERGLGRNRMVEEFGVLGMVVEQHARYHMQVYLDQAVNVITSLYADGARLFFYHKMFRGEQVAIDDLVELALVSRSRRPTRIPWDFIQKLQGKYI